jgi:hypothetical protein
VLLLLLRSDGKDERILCGVKLFRHSHFGESARRKVLLFMEEKWDYEWQIEQYDENWIYSVCFRLLLSFIAAHKSTLRYFWVLFGERKERNFLMTTVVVFFDLSLQIGYLDVVIPPDFVQEETSSDLIVPEGGSVRLTCRFDAYALKQRI